MNKIILSLSVLLICFTSSCQKKTEDVHTIKVAATTTPQAEMLEFIKPQLQQQGYTLQIIVTDDYNLPNRAVADRDVDANFFQHIPFLNKQIEQFQYDLCILAKTHIEPMGIYSKKLTSLNLIQTGAVIAIPSDPSNEGRALELLATTGLIEIKQSGKESTTIRDIVSNPKKLKFQELDAAMLARSLDDVTAALIPTNFALQASLVPVKDALAIEGPNSLYVNVIVIRCADQNEPKLNALKEAMNSRQLAEFIHSRYKSAIEPAFIPS
ncbi:MAG: MetQ/NlpA family ABC transporter substrate-binding protein [Chlamydiae bacterium]|nr:MetQ/NlpA family ABC transporter substrate-binding protein [Chlamydiota bacterium]